MAKSKGTKTLIRELALLLDETNISEIEIEEDGLRVRVARNTGGGTYVQQTPAAPITAPAAAVAAETPAPAAVEKSNNNAVKSPMVGTAYLAPEPGSDPFVKVGDKVKSGQTILIIEAMKVMNAITAPSAGTISEILVADGEPIEYDQALIVIE